ncbi:OsmC family protein [uncultured Bradyrhizobium sp.]|uniref:OsmC family protein n=1 Tax=uncultured Bradyrhizobium sp. TaxID=199684 RepID=UPI0035CA2415
MIHFGATVLWRRAASDPFIDNRYSRAHFWRFDGGAQVAASSSPHIVPLPYSSAENVDPEEAYVAALSSCHMLTFLYLAATHGFVVDSYDDDAEGAMEEDERGRLSVGKVLLKPKVTYSGKAPDRSTHESLHHQAHEQCFLANSVRTAIEVTV